MLISTLFFLIFSGLFSQSLIKISGNHILQLQQISSAYEAKTTLNMSKELLRQKADTEEIPEKGSILTSAGTVLVERQEAPAEYIFTLTLTTNTKTQYSDEFVLELPQEEKDTKAKDEETDEKEEIEKQVDEKQVDEKQVDEKQVDEKQTPSKGEVEERMRESEGESEQDHKNETKEMPILHQ